MGRAQQRLLARWIKGLLARRSRRCAAAAFGRWRQMATRAAVAVVVARPAVSSRRSLGRLFSACVRRYLLVLAKGFWRWVAAARCLSVQERGRQQLDEQEATQYALEGAAAGREGVAAALLSYRIMRGMRAKQTATAFQRWWRMACVGAAAAATAATSTAALGVTKGAAAVVTVLRASWAKKQAYRQAHGFAQWRRFAFPPKRKNAAPEWLVWPVRCWSLATAAVRQREVLREEIRRHLVATNCTLRSRVVRSCILRWGAGAKRKAFRHWHRRTVPMIRARFSVRTHQ